MAPHEIIRLCNGIEALAATLEQFAARGDGDGAQATLLRMELAALTTELIATDLIERARHSSALH